MLAAALLGFATTLPLAADTPQDTLLGLGVQPVEYFYTGKPYDADTESYTFKYRSYVPKLNRWTAADSSGFPDGANSLTYINNHLLSAADFASLAEQPFVGKLNYNIPGTSAALYLEASGKYTYTLDNDNKHFTSLGGGSWIDSGTGALSVKLPNGTYYTISTGAIMETDRGIDKTVPDENGIVWKTDWIVITAYFKITTVFRNEKEEIVTTVEKFLVNDMRIEGVQYE